LPQIAVNSFKDILNSNCFSIFEISINKGEEYVSAQLITGLIDLFEFFAVGRTIDEHQIKQINSLILSRYANLTLADFLLIFNMAKTSNFSQKIYDHIDGAIFFSWVNEYIEQKRNETERMKRAASLPPIRKITNEEKAESQKIINEIKIKLENKRKALNKEILIINEAAPKSETDILIQKWIKHFQNLSNRQNFKTSGGRFLRRGNKIYNLDEFINYRFQLLETIKNR